MSKNAFFWFRRDLRLEDNAGLYRALSENESVRLVFIFDETILQHLPKKDQRVLFIYQSVSEIKSQLQQAGSDLEIYHGDPQKIWQKLLSAEKANIYTNEDYEPSARARDETVTALCEKVGCALKSYKDQVIFEKHEVLTGSDTVYTVFTPYKKKWLQLASPFYLKSYPTTEYLKNAAQKVNPQPLLTLQQLGFESSEVLFPPKSVSKSLVEAYASQRDFPAVRGTSHLGLHLRFGTLSIRELARFAKEHSAVWLSELIWRDFFMQILFHFPHVEKASFRPEYDKIKWRHSPGDFERWKNGTTGYPMVDAGMRELNETGFMHNRSRMVTASFLCKHLLIYWLEGERYFAEKLLDYDLSANNGNWQWAAGSGCDAAPYFRVFNPTAQQEKFDKNEDYIRKWIPELGTARYPEPMIDHVFARDRALSAYKAALRKNSV